MGRLFVGLHLFVGQSLRLCRFGGVRVADPAWEAHVRLPFVVIDGQTHWPQRDGASGSSGRPMLGT